MLNQREVHILLPPCNLNKLRGRPFTHKGRNQKIKEQREKAVKVAEPEFQLCHLKLSEVKVGSSFNTKR